MTDTRYALPATAAASAIENPRSAAGSMSFPLGIAVNYSLAHLGTGLLWGLFNNGMPLYLDSYRLDPWLIGFLANERCAFAILVEPIVGRISDGLRTPLGRRRPFFLACIPVVAAALLLLAFHPGFWAMFALVALAAVSIWAARDAYTALLGDLFTMSQRGRIGGITGLAMGAGSAIFVLLASALWDRAEFAVFALVAVGLVAGWGWTFFTVKEPQCEISGPRGGAGAVIAAPIARRGAAGLPRPLEYVRGLREYPEVFKFVLADCIFWLGLGGATPFVTLFAVKVLHTTKGEAFLATLGYLLMSILVAVPAGILADRIGKKKVLTIAMLVFSGAAVVASLSGSFWQLTAALGLCGIGSACASYLDAAQMADLVPAARRAELMGLGSGLDALMLPIGSVLAGLSVSLAAPFVGEVDAYRAPFIFGGAAILLAAVLLQRVRPERVVPA